jgi:hypothetical protein
MFKAAIINLTKSFATTQFQLRSMTSVPKVKIFEWIIIFELFSSIYVLKRLWQLGKLNHVAIAVPDMDQAVSLYKNVLNANKVSEKVV